MKMKSKKSQNSRKVPSGCPSWVVKFWVVEVGGRMEKEEQGGKCKGAKGGGETGCGERVGG